MSKQAAVEIIPFKDAYMEQLTSVWERSVLATHHFLAKPDFDEIKNVVSCLDFNKLGVFCLVRNNLLVGFIGVLEGKIEMLFLDPEFIGQGWGKKLVNFATNELGADKLDVNEQNISAVKFYQKLGFEVYERTEKDDQGRDYPLLRMRLKKTASIT